MSVVCHAAEADWSSTEAARTTTAAGLLLLTGWSPPAPDAGRPFTSAALVLAPGSRLALVSQASADRDRARSVLEIMTAANAIAAVNGGYFTREFLPAGLLQIAGREMAPASGLPPFSGFLAIDADGTVTLPTRQEGHAGSVSARQAGPFLIDPGGAVGIQAGTHPPAARRTVICLSHGHQLALVATSEVTLPDLARCLHDHPKGFGIPDVDRALNMDGGPSTALCVAGRANPTVYQEMAPVRDIIVVLPAGSVRRP